MLTNEKIEAIANNTFWPPEVMSVARELLAIRKACPCNCHDQPSSFESMGLKEHEHCGICARELREEAEALHSIELNSVLEGDGDVD